MMQTAPKRSTAHHRPGSFLFALTPREKELLIAVDEHGGVTKAATALGLRLSSFSTRLQTIREKLGVKTNALAIALLKENRTNGA